MRKKRGSLGCFFSLIKMAFLVSLLLLLYFGYKIYKNIERVEGYRGQVSELTKTYGIEQYNDLVLAIIYTESKGQGTDLMQSSESLTGEQALIDTQAESLEQGVQYLAQAIQLSEITDSDLWTAVQAYNFGLDYVYYVQENGGENTTELAETYSRDVIAPLLGNESRSQYRYWRIPAILYNQGYLYENGGNFFYAEVVKANQTLIKIYERIFD